MRCDDLLTELEVPSILHESNAEFRPGHGILGFFLNAYAETRQHLFPPPRNAVDIQESSKKYGSEHQGTRMIMRSMTPNWIALALTCALIAPPAYSQDKTKVPTGGAAEEWKKQRRATVEVARREKDANLKMLEKERDPKKLAHFISRLGDTADETVITPLLQIIDDSTQEESPRVYAIDALLRIASNPERTQGATSMVMRDAKPRVKKALGASSKRLRRMAAQFLYRTGDKESARPVLAEALKGGEWGLLSTFLYHRVEGPVQVLGGMPGEKQRVDQDAKPILESAVGKTFPDEVRYRSALMLVELGEKDAALSALEDLIFNGTDRSIRTRSLSSVADIGGDRAHEILVKAETISELRSFARRMLMRKR
jgi:hypothetical protein